MDRRFFVLGRSKMRIFGDMAGSTPRLCTKSTKCFNPYLTQRYNEGVPTFGFWCEGKVWIRPCRHLARSYSPVDALSAAVLCHAPRAERLSAKRVLLPQGSTGEVQNGYDYLCKYSRFFFSEVDHANGEALKKILTSYTTFEKLKSVQLKTRNRASFY